MANTYVWQFESLDVYPTYETVTDAVFSVHWRLHADDGNDHRASVYGEQRCGDIDPNDFIPFNQLTEAEVQSWVEGQMGSAGISELYASLDSQIADQINPPSVSMAPPWL